MKMKKALSGNLSLALLLLIAIQISGVAQRPQKNQTAPTKKTTVIEAWRKQPPPQVPPRPLKLPNQREVKLDNGLTLILIPDHRIPMVSVNLGIPVGDINDPPNLTGLAETTAALITEGSGNRTSVEIDREVETLGAQLSAASYEDYTEIMTTVIAENLERMLEVFSDAVLHPSFPENEVALYKKNRVESLTVQRQEPSFLVARQFYKAIYGAHPYANSTPTPESIAAIDRAKIASFHKSYYTPTNSILVVTGDFDATKIQGKLEALFGKWQSADSQTATLPAMPESTKRKIYLIDRAASEQADFRIGSLGVARADADFFPLLVANAILGDGTSSRLFLNLREKKGFTYDVSSSVAAPRQRGVFFGASETRTAVTLAAIKEMLAEFERLRRVPVSAADLQNAKNYLNGYFSLSLSTQGGITDRIVTYRMLGLPKTILETYRERVEAVTAEQIQQAAQKYIQTNDAIIIVVGDAAKLGAQLAELGTVEVLNLEGKFVKRIEPRKRLR
ncbi:MAG: pitrilysin family protein [Acidobacteriota bacterium]